MVAPEQLGKLCPLSRAAGSNPVTTANKKVVMKLNIKAFILQMEEEQKRFESKFGPGVKIGMPWISDTGNDFGLENLVQNRKKLQLYLEQETEVLEEDEDYKFFLAGSWDDFGYLVKFDKKENEIVYLCKFQVSSLAPAFSKVVTQTEVWRALKTMPGIAKKTFFEILIPRYGAILSDKIHTERGKEFWVSCMEEALRKGLKVGVVAGPRFFNKPEEITLEAFLKEISTWNKGKENKERDTKIQFLIFEK